MMFYEDIHNKHNLSCICMFPLHWEVICSILFYFPVHWFIFRAENVFLPSHTTSKNISNSHPRQYCATAKTYFARLTGVVTANLDFTCEFFPETGCSNQIFPCYYFVHHLVPVLSFLIWHLTLVCENSIFTEIYHLTWLPCSSLTFCWTFFMKRASFICLFRRITMLPHDSAKVKRITRQVNVMATSWKRKYA